MNITRQSLQLVCSSRLSFTTGTEIALDESVVSESCSSFNPIFTRKFGAKHLPTSSSATD